MPKEDGTPTKEELLAAIEQDKTGTAPKTPEKKEETQEEEYSEIELEAMQHGWNPDGVDGKKNLSAEEFMDRQPFYDEIRSLKKEARRLRDGVTALQKERKVIAQEARKQAIAELVEQKKQALEDNDYDAVVDIDDKIMDAKAEMKVATEDTSATNPEFEDWLESNQWYNQDQDMQNYANEIGAGIAQRNPNKNLTEIYELVTQRVKEHYPQKFGPRRSRTTAVEAPSNGRRASRSNKPTIADLPEDAQALMPMILKSTGMSEEEYLNSYFSQ